MSESEECSENYEEIKARLLESGSLFEDEEFPASQSSIFYQQEPDREVEAEWKRPHEICEDPHFILDGASKYDVDQGGMGNCWFLAAASVLTTNKVLFDRVVPSNQSFDSGEYAGIFRFYFWRFGEWKEVVVDDKLPTHKGSLMFCRNTQEQNEFWSALLEKAYAKLHGSYQATEGGQPQDALVDLTGGIGEGLKVKDYVEKPNELFTLIARTFKMDSLMCCSTGQIGEGREVLLDTGLVSTHAYSINNLVQFDNSDGDTVKLIRLLNPWGRREWNGAWSDGSDEWNTITDEQRESLDLTTANEGEFWMAIEDFMQNFNLLNISHLAPGSMTTSERHREWNMTSHHGEWLEGLTAGGAGQAPNQSKFWTNPQFSVKLTDPDEGDNIEACSVIVSLMQKNRRTERTPFAPIGLNIFKYRGEPEELDEAADPTEFASQAGSTVFQYQRETVGRFHLAPGAYCIIPAVFQPDVEAEFLLRVATEKPAESGYFPTLQATSLAGAKRKKFNRLFQRFARDDNKVDFIGVQKMLNKGFKSRDGEGLTEETCQSLVSLCAPENDGLPTKTECKAIWRKVFDLESFFQEFDTNETGYLGRENLQSALTQTGLSFSKKCLAYIGTTYCEKEGDLSWDDFVYNTIKHNHLFENLKSKGTEEGMETVDFEKI